MKTKTAKTLVKSKGLSTSKNSENLVRIAGLEPARVAPLPPQSSVSANSTICAPAVIINQAARPCASDFNCRRAIATRARSQDAPD